MRKFNYSVDIHFKGWGWDTFLVSADCVCNARYMACKRVKDEFPIEYYNSIDAVRVYNSTATELYKEYIID